MAAVLAWRDLRWRVTNLEAWKEANLHTTMQAAENISLLRLAVVKIEALAAGQERRITLVEDRIEWRSDRPTH